MHRIYFEKRCIMICSPDDQTLSDPNIIRFSLGESPDIHSLVEMVEVSESLHRVCIPSSDPEDTYRKICAESENTYYVRGIYNPIRIHISSAYLK